MREHGSSQPKLFLIKKHAASQRLLPGSLRHAFFMAVYSMVRANFFTARKKVMAMKNKSAPAWG